MPRHGRVPPVLAALLLAVAACGPTPTPSVAPAATGATPATPSPAPSRTPYTASAWPAAGSACDLPGYGGLIGRIAATDATTIQFQLCRPDGAFPVRLADPAMGIVPAAWLGRLAADPSAARSLVGAGAYRIASWQPGADVILSSTAASGLTPTIVLRWSADPAARLAELTAATVDAIDAPGPAQVDAIDTLPELAVVPRPGLAVAYLAFGTGPAFSDVRVRRAIASGFDRAAIVAAAFPPGSTVATHVVPCALPGACGGHPWYDFNGPAAAAALAAVNYNVGTAVLIHVPDAPMPGLPDPAAAATAVAAQLNASLGIAASIDVMPAGDFAAAVASGTLGGLYLFGATAGVADAAQYLEPLVSTASPAVLARKLTAARSALAGIDASTDPAQRASAVKTATDAIRDAAPVVPIAVVGSDVAIRTDVAGLLASPLGADPLGQATPGDRGQLAVMGVAEPSGAYCGDQRSLDALRLCSLVATGLYAFDNATMTAEPALASSCVPSPDATVWTCTLRRGAAYSDHSAVEAGDVLATFVAQWDPSSALRQSRPPGTFTTWSLLFGAPLPSGS